MSGRHRFILDPPLGLSLHAIAFHVVFHAAASSKSFGFFDVLFEFAFLLSVSTQCFIENGTIHRLQKGHMYKGIVFFRYSAVASRDFMVRIVLAKETETEPTSRSSDCLWLLQKKKNSLFHTMAEKNTNLTIGSKHQHLRPWGGGSHDQG